MALTRSRTALGFDRLAGVYDRLATLVYGNALHKAQTCFLESLPKNASILVIGGGSGRFLEALLRRAMPSHVKYVDISPRMLRLSRDRILRNCPESLDCVEFVLEDAEMLQESISYNVLVTHCLLDMFEGARLERLMGRLAACIGSNGLWYFCDFRKSTSFPMSWISSLLIWTMYRFFRIWCGIPARRLPDFDAAFVRHQMRLMLRRQFYGGMIEAQLMSKS